MLASPVLTPLRTLGCGWISSVPLEVKQSRISIDASTVGLPQVSLAGGFGLILAVITTTAMATLRVSVGRCVSLRVGAGQARVRHQSRRGNNEKTSSRRSSFAGSSAGPSFQTTMDLLQGIWEDDIGLSIEISGSTARFSDGTGEWPIQTIDGRVELRGTILMTDLDQPVLVWQFPTGMLRKWARRLPISPEMLAWRDVFQSYKDERLQIRRQLWAAAASQDFERAVDLKSAWHEGSLPSKVSLEQQGRLAAGRWLVPGMCISHKRFGYRGVVISCEPWCTGTSIWRERMGVVRLPRGEAQPFYHCLVDDRDQSGQMTFVAEENLEILDEAYPVQSNFVDEFLVNCSELPGYLPGPKLEEALRRQREGSTFTLKMI